MVVPNQSFLSQSNSYDLKPLVEKLCSTFHLFEPSKKFLNTLAVKLETTQKAAKPPTNQSNHTQTNQTSPKPATIQANHLQASHKRAKPPTNQPNTGQITHKPANYEQKISFYVTKNFSNNAKHMLCLQPSNSIILTFSIEDQGQVGIKGK